MMWQIGESFLLVKIFSYTVHCMACSYTVTISPATIPSFAVLPTEELAFQCATLLNWEWGLQRDKAMNLAVLCGICGYFFSA